MYACSVDGQVGDQSESLDLYYYDQLARQTETIRLTISKSKENVLRSCVICLDCATEPGTKEQDVDADPPLELVLGTKWKNPSVDWNGAEVLL